MHRHVIRMICISRKFGIFSTVCRSQVLGILPRFAVSGAL